MEKDVVDAPGDDEGTEDAEEEAEMERRLVRQEEKKMEEVPFQWWISGGRGRNRHPSTSILIGYFFKSRFVSESVKIRHR